MDEEKIWYLKRLKLFEGIGKGEQLLELDKIAHHKQYKKDETIFLPGDRRRTVYLLKKGHIKLCRISARGKSITLAILEPGEIFGEMEALTDSPRTTVAESLDPIEPVLVCEILHDDFERYLCLFPEIAVRVLKLAGAREKQLESRIEDLAFRSVPARLANLFLDLSKKYGKSSSAGLRISLRLTHQNLADLVGANRETVTTVIGEFVKAGMITQKSGYISILDKHRLAQIC